jgi:hypothetical protein
MLIARLGLAPELIIFNQLNIRRSARLDLTMSTAISYANCQARFATYDLQVICSKSYASRMLPILLQSQPGN